MQRRAQYGCFIFTWPHSLTPANVSALRKSLKIIKKLIHETDSTQQSAVIFPYFAFKAIAEKDEKSVMSFKPVCLLRIPKI